MRRRIVDVYCHCGVHKSRPVDDVLEALDGAGVERAVLVQHLGEFDNQSIGRAVAAHPDRFTGVCLIDHGALRAHRESGHFEGVRIQLQHLAAAGDLFHAAVEMELHIVLCTIGGLQPHLAELRTFLEGHPSARVTLTHW